MSEVFFSQMLFCVCVNETEGNSRRGPCPHKKNTEIRGGSFRTKAFLLQV